MWEQRSWLHNDLVALIELALNSTNGDANTASIKLEQKLRAFPAADAFAAALDERVRARLFSVNTGQFFDTWLEKVDKWLKEVQNPRFVPTIESSILYILWDRFSSELSDNLRRARVAGTVPIDGYVLAFVSDLSKCVVVHYKFAGLIPRLEPKVVIDSPRSAFDIWDTIESLDQSSKNYLKRVLTSGHKLICHRGILVHVDRRHEPRVFGPSIDTILMSEELARSYYEDFTPDEVVFEDGPKRVLEIGVGSGFLSSGIIRYMSSIKELICIDVETTAIFCTEKNIKVTLLAPGVQQPKIIYSIGPFDSTKFYSQKLDLIICNPPYIPFPPERREVKHDATHYLDAVGGLELIENILKELPMILEPGGKLLLMVSNLSLEETLEIVPEGFTVSRPLGTGGYKVLFDVEDVLEDEDWMHYLQNKDNGKLFNQKGEYVHLLHPLWISAKS